MQAGKKNINNSRSVCVHPQQTNYRGLRRVKFERGSIVPAVCKEHSTMPSDRCSDKEVSESPTCLVREGLGPSCVACVMHRSVLVALSH